MQVHMFGENYWIPFWITIKKTKSISSKIGDVKHSRILLPNKMYIFDPKETVGTNFLPETIINIEL